MRWTQAFARGIALLACASLLTSCAGSRSGTGNGTSVPPGSTAGPTLGSEVTATPRRSTRGLGTGEKIDVPDRWRLVDPDGLAVLPRPGRGTPSVNDEAYSDTYFKYYGVNPTVDTEEDPFSTFSIDVDTASYSLTRAYLQGGTLIPEEAVRVEEFVNAFDYDYRRPRRDPFEVSAEVFPSPHRSGYHVLHLGLAGRAIDRKERLPANLAFVIDGSGSMARGNRLELVKRSLELLLDQLDSRDRVGIVVFQDEARVWLPLTPASRRRVILAALDRIGPGGSTNAQAGIELGYEMLDDDLRRGEIHRVILCSDGVANTGLDTSASGIFSRIRKYVERGITISTVGFGMGNFNDVLLEQLAQKGDGQYAYVDDEREARKLFVDRLTGTLQVVARDVKLQLELDPRAVSRWRLIGYENRRLDREDFEDDAVDAGEIGAGHSVTAIYELKLRPDARALGVFRVRYKDRQGADSREIERPLPVSIMRSSIRRASPPSQLAYVVAGFAEKLRGSYWVRKLDYAALLELHEGLPAGLRAREDVAELGRLIERARELDRRGDKFAAQQPQEQIDWDTLPVLR